MSQFIVWYLSYLLYVAASAQTYQTYHICYMQRVLRLTILITVATCRSECADSPAPAMTQDYQHSSKNNAYFLF